MTNTAMEVMLWLLGGCAVGGSGSMIVIGVNSALSPSKMKKRPVSAVGSAAAGAVTESKALAVPTVTYEQYGHPWAPFPELKGKLPPPPVGYRWEISANINGFGNPALRLGLLNLAYDEVTDYAERDMVVIRRWRFAEDDTFAAFYRRALEMKGGHLKMTTDDWGYPQAVPDTAAAEALAKKVFYAHLISPLADWALAEVARKAVTSPLALGTSYELVQLEEAPDDGPRLVDSLKKAYA